jgi:hypothetical protein
MQKYYTEVENNFKILSGGLTVHILSKFIEMTKDEQTNMHIMTIASDCCLMPTQQFFSYIMERTS